MRDSSGVTKVRKVLPFQGLGNTELLVVFTQMSSTQD